MPAYHKACFVRAVGAEVWAEMHNDDRFSPSEVDAAVEIVMSVLARHHGELVYNDPTVPVPARASRKREPRD